MGEDNLPRFRPVDGVVSSPFGPRINPVTGEDGFHYGIDIAADVGTPVQAAAEGIVRYCGWRYWYGKVVVIQHNTTVSTMYGHLSKVWVREGQHVKTGEKIGTIGSTGRSTGPHLHYEVRKEEVAVDPVAYLPRDIDLGSESVDAVAVAQNESVEPVGDTTVQETGSSARSVGE